MCPRLAKLTACRMQQPLPDIACSCMGLVQNSCWIWCLCQTSFACWIWQMGSVCGPIPVQPQTACAGLGQHKYYIQCTIQADPSSSCTIKCQIGSMHHMQREARLSACCTQCTGRRPIGSTPDTIIGLHRPDTGHIFDTTALGDATWNFSPSTPDSTLAI